MDRLNNELFKLYFKLLISFLDISIIEEEYNIILGQDGPIVLKYDSNWLKQICVVINLTCEVGLVILTWIGHFKAYIFMACPKKCRIKRID